MMNGPVKLTLALGMAFLGTTAGSPIKDGTHSQAGLEVADTLWRWPPLPYNLELSVPPPMTLFRGGVEMRHSAALNARDVLALALAECGAMPVANRDSATQAGSASGDPSQGTRLTSESRSVCVAQVEALWASHILRTGSHCIVWLSKLNDDALMEEVRCFFGLSVLVVSAFVASMLALQQLQCQALCSSLFTLFQSETHTRCFAFKLLCVKVYDRVSWASHGSHRYTGTRAVTVTVAP
jgi:hypothetical protein